MNDEKLRKRLRIHEHPPIERLLSPFRSFIHAEVSSGILLVSAALVALIWANSPWAESYTLLQEMDISIRFGDLEVSESLLHWINDGLMAMFFFVVGLEIKRELLVGELASPRLAALPLLAAVGGMLVPALIYTALNYGRPEAHGWGIPMATDIAFSLGILHLLGNRVPGGLKIFLASLAIADDLGAVIAIALFYTSNISYLSLLAGAGLLGFVAVLNYLGVRSTLVYGVFGIGGVWLAFLFSGVHPTIAGVLMAMLIPASMRINPRTFVDRSRSALTRFEDAGSPMAHTLMSTARQNALHELDVVTDQARTPLQRIEKGLHPWVSFLVLPLFALANAGVTLDEGVFGSVLTDRVTLGIILGLVLGKQVGVTFFAWLAVRLGLAQLPAGVTWGYLYGVSWLAGIGFTMSLFIGGLAFNDAAHLAMAKVGVLGGSLIAGSVGILVLLRAGRPAVHGDAAARF
jgi:NhaA family Na+:H+ antiporter